MGPWLGTGEPSLVPANSTEEQLGEATQRHLAASTKKIPFPSKDAAKSDELLKAAGVASWKTFEKLAKFVTVEADATLLTITPHKSSRPGFIVIDGGAVRVPVDIGAQVLGEHLRRALEVSG